MAVVRTDDWLKVDFDNPESLCGRLPFMKKEQNGSLYRYLRKFGMYRPNPVCRRVYNNLAEDNYWEKSAECFEKYKKKWEGPDVPIYIFPIDSGYMRAGNQKSGVTFLEGIVLFLSPLDDIKELESLIVHEYHHACRMKVQKKNPQQYNLLDSMVLEGLAEYMVEVECGKQYIGKWSESLNQEEWPRWWREHAVKNLKVSREDRIHDKLLFGGGKYPVLLGYILGYQLVKRYAEGKNFSAKASFFLESEKITKYLKFST